jgi:hypothetical protein
MTLATAATSYTLTHYARPFSLNERDGRWAERERIAEWRKAWWVLALAELRGVKLERVRVDAQPFGVRQDPGNCYLAVKAAIDGIVDARVLPGDTGEFIEAITLWAPVTGLKPALRLTLTPTR